ncbi:MAG: hypothetical protein CMC86_00350 [Flavobacteriaceae bacterium]|nr:hypothetical protein [Flavobacteriaceae bacterium]|tara:strand:- start:876 stop:2759 length:1884 start_codon:yes stop_codon:yes gene_type:complete
MKTKLLLFFLLLISSVSAQQTYTLEWWYDSTDQQITIEVGDIVEWTWGTSGNHNIEHTSGPEIGFGEGYFGPGHVYSHQFTTPGVNTYVCSPHQSMYGTITVNAVAQSFSEGDIIVTEFLNDAGAVSDVPGEWLEIYNNTEADIDLLGWTLKDDGSDSHTFSTSVIVPPGVYFVMGRGPNDPALNGGVNLDHSYGDGVFTLGNSVDEIVLLSPNSVEIDRIVYGSANGFPDAGGGTSISLDPDEIFGDNNLGSNWCLSTSTFGEGDLGTPGAPNDLCGPTCEVSLGTQDIVCDDITTGTDTYTVTLAYTGAGNSTFVVSSTAGNISGDNPSTTPDGNIIISGILEGTDIVINVSDTVAGGVCNLSRNVTSPVCEPTGSVDLELQGILDLSLSGSNGKAIHVVANSDIPDLSVYGIGVANNGGGTDGQEYTFDPISVSSGDHILVARSLTDMESYFEDCYNDFTYTLVASSSISQNGDDAIELFKNGSVVETFGDINTDGSGEVWDYMDSWAYKVDGLWTYGGVDCTDGSTTTSTSNCPYPFCSPLSTSDLTINKISVFPNPVSNGIVNIKSQNLGDVNAKLYDIMGRCVLSTKINSETLDVSSVGPGVYLLQVSVGDSSNTTKLVLR